MYDENEPDPWELLISAVMRIDTLEDQVIRLMDSANKQMSIIQQLLHQNQQLSIQAKELTDYVTTRLRT
tara:strand:+ start:45 stop:251 length:207 start_codon:yes stop_codon:yes gene_type:complete